MKNMLGAKVLPSYLLSKDMQMHSGVHLKRITASCGCTNAMH